MYLKDPTSLDPGEKWEKYAENLRNIKRFFDQCVINKYEYSQASGKASQLYNKTMIDNYDESFVVFIQSLTNRTRLYHKYKYVDSFQRTVKQSDYQASRKLEFMKSQGYKEINWKIVK